MCLFMFFTTFFSLCNYSQTWCFCFSSWNWFSFFFSQKHALTSWFPRIMRKCWRPVARIFGQMNARHTEDRLDWNRNKWTWWKLFLKGTKKRKEKKSTFYFHLSLGSIQCMYLDHVLHSGVSPENFFKGLSGETP